MGHLRVLFEQNVCRLFWVAIGLVVLDSFQSKLYHFGQDEELLEHGCLLAVLREDEELSHELKCAKVLQVELRRHLDGQKAVFHL